MTTKYPGISLNGKKLRITFSYQGEICREQLDIGTSAQAWKSAALLRAEILQKIDIGIFEYASYFPNSKKLEKFGGKKQVYTFEEYSHIWLGTLKVATSSLKAYKVSLNSFWIPALGGMLLGAIKRSDIATIISKSDLAHKTINNYLVAARCMFATALEDGLIEKSPMEFIKQLPVQKREPMPLEIEEIEIVLLYMGNNYSSQVLNYFKFAFFTGLRPSELIALRWADIEWQKKIVRVEVAFVLGEEKDTKTHKVRYVDLPEPAFEALKSQKLSTLMKKHGRVFENPTTGRPWASHKVPRLSYWKPCLNALGIMARDAYQTRHTYATMMLGVGCSPRYVADQLGHGTLQMLLTTYSKWLPSGNEAEKAKVAIALSTKMQKTGT